MIPAMSASVIPADQARDSDRMASVVLGKPYQSADGDEKMGTCFFDCGPPRPMSQLTNTANKGYPRYSCCPCNMARKAIERAWGPKSRSPEFHHALLNLKGKDTDR